MRHLPKRNRRAGTAAAMGRAVLALTLLTGLLGFTAATASADHAEGVEAEFIVTFTNLTEGQPMTPPVVAIHDGETELAVPRAISTPEIEAIAEGGDNAPLLAALAASDGVSAYGVAGEEPFGPGDSVSVTLATDDDTLWISSLNMLICTNDGITGLNSFALPASGSRTTMIRAWDAGTERNTTRVGDVPPAPDCAGLRPGGVEDQDAISESRPIRMHPGVRNSGALNFDRGDHVIQVRVTRVQQYNVSFTNLTEGQPMTPPVVAIHSPLISLFDVGGTASAGVEAIAEGGDNVPLLDALAATSGVRAYGVAGAEPFGPSETVDVTLPITVQGQVLSAVNMLICTNDGFTGLHNVALPATGTSDTYMAVSYDAGTEINTFLAGDVPGAPACAELPAGGGGDQDLLTEGAAITMHPGLSGSGALDFGSGVSVIEIVVSNIG